MGIAGSLLLPLIAYASSEFLFNDCERPEFYLGLGACLRFGNQSS